MNKKVLSKLKNLAYNVLALKKEKEKNKEDINRIEYEILEILNDIPCDLDKIFIDKEIRDIFNESLKNKKSLAF